MTGPVDHAPGGRRVTAGSVCCLGLAAAAAGLLFAPVFGVPALLLPVGVPAGVVSLAALVDARRPALAGWRPLLLAGVGLLAVVETTLWPSTTAGLPTGETLRTLVAGATDAWRLTLQSTWPARPEPELLLFVPLLVVLAAVLGIELLHRLGTALPALAPSCAVAVFSQCYAPLSTGPGTAAAVGYAAVAGAFLVSTGPGGTVGAGGVGGPAAVRYADSAAGRTARLVTALSRRAATLPRLVPPLVLAVVGAVVAGLLLPSAAPRYALHRDQAAPLADNRVASPLDEIAYRLAHPGDEVFRVHGAVGVDRWPLVTLDAFDGVNWTPGGRYRRLGTEVPPGPAVTVPVRRHTAQIETNGAAGPWLPSQTWPAGVRGVEPLIEQRHGTLLLPGAGGPARYTLSWWQPRIDAATLAAAAIDPDAPGGLGGVGTVPPGVAELAEQAVRGGRPTFQTALVLERFFRDNYQVAVDDLPTGHAWPQLTEFLLGDRRGTSEQFAAGYVVLARIRGIPARLVVGFRAPADRAPGGSYSVRNADVLAWPEVAVEGVGWVPLDPTGSTTAPAGATEGGLGALTARVRAGLPAPEELRDPPVAPASPIAASAESDQGRIRLPWLGLVAVPALALVGWLVGVPAAKTTRRWRRRNRPGPATVVGAWAEVRDRLRGHGVPVSPGMTLRDLAGAARPVVDPATVEQVRRLATLVDRVLWSGAAPGPDIGGEAWAVERAIRRGLARRGWRARLRALFDPRTLR